MNPTAFAELRQSIAAKNARLVAVSKTQPESAILELYALGQRVFGENRAQELQAKHAALPKDIEWHLIGSLQTNKVKLVAPFVHWIHSVDSLHLLQEIDRQAARNQRVIDVLLQIKIAQEDTKQGLSAEDARALLSTGDFRSLQHLRVRGLMGMASFTDDLVQVRSEFRLLATVFAELKQTFFSEKNDFTELSMGMSGDYALALEEGSTMVRIGSLLFGERS